MSRFRSRWLALFGAVTILSLSLSTALAGKPDGENRGQQVSAFVHSLQATDEESAPSDHGQCVALVAQDKEAVGPPNDNHGGAVSEAARVTCWEDAASDESSGEEPSEDENDSEVESNEDGDSEDSEESEDAEDSDDSDDSEDAEESDSGSDHGNDQGHDDEGEGSDD
jgi:hypothetical protein